MSTPNTLRNPAPFALKVSTAPDGRNLIEVRPTTGSWSPFMFAIPIKEIEPVDPVFYRGPRGIIPTAININQLNFEPSGDNKWWIMSAGDPATDTTSYFLFCNELPSALYFGVLNRPSEQFLIEDISAY